MVKNSLKSLIPQLNERVNVSMDLVHISKTGEVQRGQVLYTATLFDAERAKGKCPSSLTVLLSTAGRDSDHPRQTAGVRGCRETDR